MRTLPSVVLLGLLLIACKKAVPEADLTALDQAVQSCQACLKMPGGTSGPCVGKARTDWQAARAKLTLPIDDYEAKSRDRVVASEQALTVCTNASLAASKH